MRTLGVLALAALGIVAGALAYFGSDARLTALAQRQLGQQLRGEVHIARVHLGLPLRISLEGLEVRDAAGQQPTLKIPHAELGVHLLGALRGVGVGAQLDAHDVELAIVDGPGGFALPFVPTKETKSIPAARHDTAPARSLAEQLRRLPRVRLLPSTLDIRVVHVLRAAGDSFAQRELVRDVHATAVGRGKGDGTLSVTLGADAPDVHLRATLAADAGSPARPDGAVAAHAKVDVAAHAVHALRHAAYALGYVVDVPRTAPRGAHGALSATLDVTAPLPAALIAPRDARVKLRAAATNVFDLPDVALDAHGALVAGRATLDAAHVQLGHGMLALDGALDLQSKAPTRLVAAWHAQRPGDDARAISAALRVLSRRLTKAGDLSIPTLAAPVAHAAKSLSTWAPRLPAAADVAASVRPLLGDHPTRSALDVAVQARAPALAATLHAESRARDVRTWPHEPLEAQASLSWLAPHTKLGRDAQAGARQLVAELHAAGRPAVMQGSGTLVVDELFVDRSGTHVPLGTLTLPLALRPEALELRTVQLRGGEAHLGGELLVAPPSRGAWDRAVLAGELHLRELGPHAKRLGVADTSADIFVAGNVAEPLVEARIGSRLLPWVLGHAAAPAAQDDAQDDAHGDDVHVSALASVLGQRAELRALSVRPSAGGMLSADGNVNLAQQCIELRAAARDLALPQREGRLQLALEARGGVQEGLALAADVGTRRSQLRIDGRLHTGSAPLTLALEGQLDARDIDAFLLPAQRIGLHGTANVHATVAGTAQDPTGHLAITLEQLALERAQLGEGTLVVEGSLDAQHNLLAAVHDDGTVRASLHGQRRADVWQLHAKLDELRAEAWLPPLRSTVAALRLAGTGDVAWGKSLHSRRAEVSLTRLHVSAHEHALDLATPTTVRWEPEQLWLSPLRLNGSAGHIVARAAIGPKVPAVTAQGQLELGLIAPFVPALAEATGRLAFDAELGPHNHALAGRGSLRVLTPLWVRPRGSPMELRFERGEVRLTPEALSVAKLDGTLEGGSFHVAGDIALNNFVPTHWDIALRGAGLPLHGSDLLLESNVKLALRGPGPSPTLGGDVEIVGGRYLKQVRLRDFHFVSREVDTQSPLALRAPWLGKVGLDVRAKSPAGVEIAVDAGAFAARTTLVADVRIGGNLLAPKLGGKVQASEGRLHFPRGDLHLTSAQVDFEPARRTRKEPLGAELALQAEGEVHASGAGNSTAYLVTLRLDGTPTSLALDLACDQGLSQLEVLSLLTTGHVNVSDLAQGDQDQSKLDAALALAGSQLSQPVTRFAEDKLEQALDLQLELGMELAGGNMRLTAAKNVTRRLRLESAYSHAIAQEQSNVAGRALLSLTDRLLLEGVTARDLTGPSTNASQGPSMQSNLELKYRVVGN